MTCVDDAHASGAASRDQAGNLRGYMCTIFDLAAYTGLHVVNQQRHPVRVTNLFEAFRDFQTIYAFHLLRQLCPSGSVVGLGNVDRGVEEKFKRQGRVEGYIIPLDQPGLR